MPLSFSSLQSISVKVSSSVGLPTCDLACVIREHFVTRYQSISSGKTLLDLIVRDFFLPRPTYAQPI